MRPYCKRCRSSIMSHCRLNCRSANTGRHMPSCLYFLWSAFVGTTIGVGAASWNLGEEQPFSLRTAGNVASARLTSTSVLLAWQDYGHARRGALTTCSISNGTLACEAAKLFSDNPIHHAEQSLSVGALWSNQVVLAWKDGITPYAGRLQVCRSDLSRCGEQREVAREWGCVAVLVLAFDKIVLAYTDMQRGHRGAMVACDVGSLGLVCKLEHVFETGCVNWLAMAALSADDLAYSSQNTRFIVAYEAGSGRQKFGRVQPCEWPNGLYEDLTCHQLSAANYAEGANVGVSLLGLSSTAFLVAYADKHPTCPDGSQARRRALHVCSVSDGHPSIGRAKICRVTYTAIGLLKPLVECGESAVIDDGYDTGAASLNRLDGLYFTAAYPCGGCADRTDHGLLRRCLLPADLHEGSFGDPPPDPPTCEAESRVANIGTTRWLSSAAVSGGFVVAYDDYGGRGYGRARYVQVT